MDFDGQFPAWVRIGPMGAALSGFDQRQVERFGPLADRAQIEMEARVARVPDPAPWPTMAQPTHRVRCSCSGHASGRGAGVARSQWVQTRRLPPVQPRAAVTRRRRVAALSRGSARPGLKQRGSAYTTKGRLRRRLPVRAAIALAKAGASGGRPGSPAPVGGSAEGTMCTSTCGMWAWVATR